MNLLIDLRRHHGAPVSDALAGVAFPVHRPAIAVPVGLDSLSAVAAGDHPLEQTLGTLDRAYNGPTFPAALDLFV
ncbi:MAG: hypothetical protein O3A33_03175 [Chloroflexi bacterium]|nr:hypothetical protein [Chloroflexota bacterium]